MPNNLEKVNSETCVNYLVSFLYTSLLRISKAKTVKRILHQGNNFFQSSDKKATCITRTQTKILRISEKPIIKLNIFVNFFQKETFFFKFYFAVLKECGISSSNSLHQVALPYQPTVALRHWNRYRTGTFKPLSTPLWTMCFSTVLTLSFGEVSKTCRKCTKNIRDIFNCIHTYIR